MSKSHTDRWWRCNLHPCSCSLEFLTFSWFYSFNKYLLTVYIYPRDCSRGWVWVGGENSRWNKLIDEIPHLLVFFSGFYEQGVTWEMFPATQTWIWVQALRKIKAVPGIQELSWHSQVGLGVLLLNIRPPPNYLTQAQILNVLSNPLYRDAPSFLMVCIPRFVISNKPNLSNHRTVPGGLWLEGIESFHAH